MTKTEATELIENWKKDLKKWCRVTGVTWSELEYSIEDLLNAQDLLSYELGRDEQRAEDAGIIGKFCVNLALKEENLCKCGLCAEHRNKLLQKILTPQDHDHPRKQ